MRILVFFCTFLCAVSAAAGPWNDDAKFGLGTSGGTMTGPLAWCVITQAADDATPAIGVLGGCATDTGGNILQTSDANTGALAITDLDLPLVGQVIYIVGSGGADPSTIANGGNFELEGDWVGISGRVLTLYVRADNDYLELSRHNGPRTFDGDLDLAGFNIKNTSIAYQEAQTSDVAADETMTAAGDAWAEATGGNQAGADYHQRGGIGSRQVTIDAFGNCALDTVTTTINGADCVCTEADGGGANQWDAVTDNGTSATNLAVCVDACSGVSASATAAVVYVQPDVGTLSVDLAEGDATCTTLTEGADGSVVVHAGYSQVEIAEGRLTVADGTMINEDGGTEITFPADGQWQLTPDAATTGFRLDSGTADTMTLLTLAGASGAILEMDSGTLQYGLARRSLGRSGDSMVLRAGQTFIVTQESDNGTAGTAMVTFNSAAAAEMTAATGTQFGINILPEVDQTNTAGFALIGGDVTNTGNGSGAQKLLDLKTDTVTQIEVSQAGAMYLAGVLTTGGLLLTADLDMDDYDILNPDSIHQEAPVTDVAPENVTLHSGHSYSQGSQPASNLILGGGIDEKYWLITDRTEAGDDDEFVVTVNGSSTTFLSDADFNCDGEASEAGCACLFYDHIISNPVPGMSPGKSDAGCTDAKVFVQPDDSGTYSLVLSVTDGGGGTEAGTAENGTDGLVVVASDAALYTGKKLYLDGEQASPNDYLFNISNNIFGIFINGNERLRISTTEALWRSTLVMGWNTRSQLSSPVDGNLLWTDTAGTDAGLFQGGGTTSAYPAWKRDGTAWLARLADDSDYTRILGSRVIGTLGIEGTQYVRTISIKLAYTNMNRPVAESLTFANDASKTTTTSLIADGCKGLSVTGRVTTVLAGCTSIDIGDGSDVDLFGAGISVADETTFDPTDQTADLPGTMWGGPYEVTVTANGGNCTSGVIAITVHCMSATAATSD